MCLTWIYVMIKITKHATIDPERCHILIWHVAEGLQFGGLWHNWAAIVLPAFLEQFKEFMPSPLISFICDLVFKLNSQHNVFSCDWSLHQLDDCCSGAKSITRNANFFAKGRDAKRWKKSWKTQWTFIDGGSSKDPTPARMKWSRKFRYYSLCLLLIFREATVWITVEPFSVILVTGFEHVIIKDFCAAFVRFTLVICLLPLKSTGSFALSMALGSVLRRRRDVFVSFAVKLIQLIRFSLLLSKRRGWKR